MAARPPAGERQPEGGVGTPGSPGNGRAGDDARRPARDPLDLLLLTHELVQDAVEQAVRRGVMNSRDATELVRDLIAIGRRQTDDLLAELERATGRMAAPADAVLRELERARGTTFQMEGYDDLTAAEVTARLGDLAPRDLRALRDYERRNANRKSVLAAIERKLSQS
jgi:polyhydroxyalkanoate synthesis regulator phasin